jgi:hypothetical protein
MSEIWPLAGLRSVIVPFHLLSQARLGLFCESGRPGSPARTPFTLQIFLVSQAQIVDGGPLTTPALTMVVITPLSPAMMRSRLFSGDFLGGLGMETA